MVNPASNRRFVAQAALVAAVSLCLLAVGCKRSHDDVLKALAASLKETTVVLKGVTDEVSATSARPKLKKLGEQIQALKNEMQSLPKPTDAEEAAIKTKYQTEIEQALVDYIGELARVRMDPKTAGALQDMKIIPVG